MSKKYIKTFFSLLIIILILGTGSTYSETNDLEEKRMVYDLDKEWTIEFNMPIDESTAITDNIFIMDHKLEFLAIELSVAKDKVVVKPLKPYEFNKEYTLYIDNVKGNNGNHLKKNISLNFEVIQEENSSSDELTIANISIGDSKEKLLENHGAPSEIIESSYGFDWYIYSNDYSQYMQIGVLNNEVYGIFTNGNHWVSKSGVEIGSLKSNVTNIYDSYRDDYYESDTIQVYNFEEYKMTCFYDAYNNHALTSILLLKNGVKQSNDLSLDIIERTYERQNFHLANTVRVREGKTEFLWDEAIAEVAKDHSQDMAENNYFSHISLSGKSPFDRMNDNDILYFSAGENIAAGYRSGIYAHEGWMNSEGHRNNILGDFERLGVGIKKGGSYNLYYTQNFYTPR